MQFLPIHSVQRPIRGQKRLLTEVLRQLHISRHAIEHSPDPWFVKNNQRLKGRHRSLTGVDNELGLVFHYSHRTPLNIRGIARPLARYNAQKGRFVAILLHLGKTEHGWATEQSLF